MPHTPPITPIIPITPITPIIPITPITPPIPYSLSPKKLLPLISYLKNRPCGSH